MNPGGAAIHAARVALAIGLVALVISTTDLAAVARALGGANPWIVFPALAGLAAVHLVSAGAWWWMGGTELRRRLGLVQATGIYYVAQALGAVTPANLGGDVYRVTRLRQAGMGWLSASAPVAVQRGTNYLALALLAFVAFAATTPSGNTALAMVGGLVAALIAIASAVLLSRPSWLRRRMPQVGGTTESRLGLRVLGIGVFSGLLFHMLAIGATWAILVAVDPRLNTAAVLAAVAVARLAIAVPITPSGIGVQEGALAVLVAATGGPASAAVAGMLLARGGLLLTMVLGVVAWVAPRRRHPAVPPSFAVSTRQR